MATQFIDDLATYLQTQGHGTKGTDIFRGNAPDSKTPEDTRYDNIIVINDTGGFANVLNDKGAGLEIVTVQIMARNKRQEIARDKLQAIQDDLHQLNQTNLGTFTIIAAMAVDRPAVIRKDPKERFELVSNYEIRTRS